MKRSVNVLKRVSAAAALLLAVVALTGCARATPEWEIHNPYAAVDWERHQQYKANFHTHTTMSDGGGDPETVIDRYAELGYAVLALTDHDTISPRREPDDPDRHRTTWPWESFGRDPAALGMVAVEGNEISRLHHIGSYFNDYGDAGLPSEEAAFEEIGRRGGLAVLFHPGRYDKSVDWYAGMYRSYPHLIGLEIYNQGDRYPDDRRTWDAILAEIVAERPVWGFSNDDMHSLSRHLGRNWNVLVLPELTEERVRRAMEEGVFFYVYAPEGHEGPEPAAIRSVLVDERRGRIGIEAAGHDRIEWISGGATVHEGDSVDLSEVADIAGYVRAVIHAAEGEAVVGTQPFRVAPRTR